jgi:hypothetical protein
LEPMTVGNSEMEIIHNPKTAMNSNNNNHSWSILYTTKES